MSEDFWDFRVDVCQHSWQVKSETDSQYLIQCFLCGEESAEDKPPGALETAGQGVKAFLSAVLEILYNLIAVPITFLTGLLYNWKVTLVVLALIFGMYKAATYDYVVEREPTGNSRFSTETISCTHYDYCYGCDISGKDGPECGFRYGTCNGNQEANLRYDEYQYTRKSGDQQRKERRIILKKLTQCQ